MTTAQLIDSYVDGDLHWHIFWSLTEERREDVGLPANANTGLQIGEVVDLNFDRDAGWVVIRDVPEDQMPPRECLILDVKTGHSFESLRLRVAR